MDKAHRIAIVQQEYGIISNAQDAEKVAALIISSTYEASSKRHKLFAFAYGNSVASIWTAPRNDGGDSINSYRILCKGTDGTLLWSKQTDNSTIYDTRTLNVGERYLFQVAGTNAASEGPATSYEYTVPSSEDAQINVLSQKSSISNVHYDNSTREITFNVTGTSGSLGFSFIIIPKGMVDYASMLRGTLDGETIPLEIRSTDQVYVVSIAYHHSSHEVAISWGEVNKGQNSGFDFGPFMILGPIMAISLIAAFLFVRRSRRTK